MEIVFNIEKKELTVIGSCNFVDLHKRLKKMLGDKLFQWDIVGETKWIHQYWPVIQYNEPTKLEWITTSTTGPYEITYGKDTFHDTIFCVSDEEDVW